MGGMVLAGIIAAAFAVGVLTGLIAGMLGVGGGVVMLPVFRLLFGMSAIQTTATSLFTIIPTSLSGAVSHVRGKTCAPKLGVAMGVGGALTSTLGVRLAQISPGWLIMVAAAAAIGYSAFTTLRKALALPKVKSELQSSSNADGANDVSGVVVKHDEVGVSECAHDSGAARASDSSMIDSSKEALAKAFVIGMVAGVVSGYIGLGGGFLMVPLMVSLLNMPMRLASGTSLVAIMILAIPAMIVQCMLGNVQVIVGLAVACGSVPAAVLGARLAKRVPERGLRFMFAGFLFFAALSLVAKELIA